ncbi:hypothetical protein [Achromobacter denitrificans]|uniref:Uncharacterized protein n=1 Tax=Achromobacter denitrificans TaxID=32002 RepID=A0ABZ3GE29_ACHDE
MSEKNESRDWELTCFYCNGSGHVFVERQVAERKTDVQEFKEECECCEGRGFTIAFEDIPGIAEYVRKTRPAPSAPGDAQDERSPTHGMTLGERIAHVGGRTNAQGYTEFGSPMAVNALIQHVLRDMEWTRQDDDGAYQARYRLPGGQWSTWGHVVCGVKGHEQELRYLPSERRPAPAAGDALDAARYRWLREKAHQTAGRAPAAVLCDESDMFQRGEAGSESGFIHGKDLDDAIDAALAAQVPQQGEA